MKTKLFLLMAIVLFACSTAKAYDALIDGIYYEFYGDHHASVTHVSENDEGPISNYSGDIIIPSTITYNGTAYTVQAIGNSAFYECTKLTSVAIPNSVIAIDNQAFYGCDALTSIIIPEGVTTIYSQAIRYCSNLKSVKIPNSVTSIGTDNFSNCLSLTDVYCYAEKIPETETYNFQKSNIENVTLHVPYGCKAAYEAASPWNQFGTIVEMEPESPIISFADAKVKALCVANWDTNSDGELDEAEAAAVTDLGTVFKGNTEISSFNELQYFTGLTSIGDYSFQSCSSLTTVNIPNSVTSIGEYAFFNCFGLTSITIGNGVAIVGEGAFNQCVNLGKVNITDLAAWCNINFDKYGANPLYHAHHLYLDGQEITDLIIPNSVTNIGSRAFYGCSMTSVTIPNSVTRISDAAFYYCDRLTSIAIPNSVTSISRCTFEECINLTSVTIPSSVTNIGTLAFHRCRKLADVYCYAQDVPSIESDDVFFESGIKDAILHVPYGCKAAYETAATWNEFGAIVEMEPENPIISFADAKVKALCVANWDTNSDGELDEAEADAVTDLGTVFKGNTEITSFNELQYFTGLTSIAEEAFYGCSGLTSVSIPNNVTSIGKFAFYGSGLKKVIVPDIAAWCGIEFDGSYSNPLSHTEHLYSDETTEITNLIIPNSVTSIGSSAFYYCSGLTSVTIPNSVTSIGEYTFFHCSGLTSVTIGNSVTSIGDCAFEYCSGLTSVTIPNSVTSIGYGAFEYCSGLTSVTLNSNAIASKKYTSSSSLENVFGRQVKTYILGDEVTSIGDYAFSDCSGLTSVTIPNSVTSIGDSAFEDCGLTSITIGNSVTSIGNNAFYDCDGLKKVIVPDIAAWCNITFEDCHSNPLNYAGHLYSDETTEITNLIIPNSVTSIGKGAFQGCFGLTSVNIGNSVKSIEYQAFAGCKELTDVYCLAENVPNTSNYAFSATILNATLHVPYGCKAAYEAASPWNEFGKIVEIPIPITIGETGFATFCSSHALDFSEVEDIRAYIVSGFNQETGTLVLTRVTEVPAGEGLYIAGMPGNHEIPQTKTSMFYANLLKGVTEPTIISPTDGNYTNYILSNGSYGVGFYTLSQTGTLDAGKAYLQLPTASVAGIKALKIEFDENDDPTGIAITSTSPAEENTIYNLAGQRVSKAHRGINIVNGKKVFIK